MNTILKWVLVVLIVVALILGYRIFNNQSGAMVRAPLSQQSDAATEGRIPGADITGKQVDANAVLMPPSDSATDAEKRAFAELVLSSAIRTDKIEVTSCKASPIVASFALLSDVSFVNNDSVPHTVLFDAKNTYTVPSKSSKMVKADFGHGSGIYGFGCDDSRSAVGMIVVTK